MTYADKVEKVERWECCNCYKVYKTEVDAMQCLRNHLRARIANALWEQGYDLGYIEYSAGFRWNLKYSDNFYKVNKDSCFRFDHWQLARVPAYRIESFNTNGSVFVGGNGGWMGYYGDNISISDLRKKEIYPKEEFAVYDDKWKFPNKKVEIKSKETPSKK